VNKDSIYHKEDVVEVKNFISKDICDKIIKYLDGQSERWSIFNKTFTECYGMPISLYDKNLENYDLDKDFFQQLHYKFKKSVEEFFNKDFVGVTYHAQKWNEGGMVEPHSDTSDLDGNENENSSNKYTVILYLNDDYDGGNLYFTQHNIEIKPNNGSILTFPGNHTNIHGVSKVENGTRYTIVSWWDIEEYSINEEEEAIWNQL
jgi:hypothetical protein